MRTHVNFSYMKKTNEKGAAFAMLASARGVKAGIARLLGIDLPVVNNWKERGVPGAYANAVAEILKCRPDEISDIALIDAGARQGQQASASLADYPGAIPVTLAYLSAAEKEAANLVKDLTAGEWAFVKEQLEALVAQIASLRRGEAGAGTSAINATPPEDIYTRAAKNEKEEADQTDAEHQAQQKWKKDRRQPVKQEENETTDE